MKITELLPIPKTVYELFTAYPDLWTRGKGHCGLFDETGKAVDLYDQACRLCLGSAIGFVIRQGEHYDRVLHSVPIDEAARRTIEVIRKDYPQRQWENITQWNDHPERTVEQVITVAYKARI